MKYKKHKIRLLSDTLPILLIVILILTNWPVVSMAQISTIPESLSSNQIDPVTVNSYGPVSNNEGLWDISVNVRTDQEITIEQMAVALFKQNPQAFNPQNMNNLLVDAILIIPPNSEIKLTTRQEAFSLFQEHRNEWEASRRVQPDDLSGSYLPQANAEDKKNRLKNTSANNLKRDLFPVTNTENSNIDSSTQLIQEAIDVANTLVAHTGNTPAVDNKAEFTTQPLDLLDYQNTIELSSILKQVVQGYQIVVNKINFEENLAALNEYRQYSPALFVLFITSIFLLLVLFFRRQERRMFLTGTNQQELTNFRQILTEQKKQDSSEPLSVSNQVNINKFIKTEVSESSTNILKTRKSVLETAFNPDEFCHGVGFIQEEDNSSNQVNTAQPDDMEPIASEDINLLDSIEEIRFVNQHTHDAKIKAFLSMTQENISDEELKKEWNNIRENEKVEVFIEEFEQVMKSLTQQMSTIKADIHEQENIIQFKLSVHFMKILSEMTQASYLYKFSTTVINFLDEIIDEKNYLSSDLMERLVVVVRFYKNYLQNVRLVH